MLTKRIFLSFSQIQNLLFRPFGAETGRMLVLKVLDCLHWLVQYQEKIILSYWIPSHVGIRDHEKMDAAAKAGLFKIVTNVPTSMSF